jgi:hypothetical protein
MVATYNGSKSRSPAELGFRFHEDGEVSRNLSSGDQAAASRRIQQRSESPAFLQ